ncbi:MAG: hypothetical protein WCL11_25195 [Verrucomicrobiota bacterium]
MPETGPKLPITIRIGYEWTDRNREPHTSPPVDRYRFIKKQIELVVAEVQKLAAARQGVRPLYIQVGRMRARHGAELLPRFRELCRKTDILAFDITGQNPNVMMELGMALGVKEAASGQVFIIKERCCSELEIPSDLRGYFITYIKLQPQTKSQCELKLEDVRGFKAALRADIIDLARERGMWGEKGLVEEKDDSEEPGQAPENPKGV